MRNHHFDFILNYRLLPHNKRLPLKSRPFFTFLVTWGTMQITTEAESRCLIFIKFQEFHKQHLNSSSIVNCDVKLKRDRLSFYVARRRHEDDVEISVDATWELLKKLRAHSPQPSPFDCCSDRDWPVRCTRRAVLRSLKNLNTKTCKRRPLCYFLTLHTLQ